MTENESDQKTVITEEKVIHTIVVGSDWQDVLTSLIAEDGMDPLNIDIVKLANSFSLYLGRLKGFDFRIPARFILIAAILLRMKAELLLEEEEEKIRQQEEKIPKINLEDIPQLLPPIMRKTTKKVGINELITALEKTFAFKEKKEEKKLRLRRKVIALIDDEEDIEEKIRGIFEKIMRKGSTTFSELLPSWNRKDIVDTFLPLLYLSNRGKISCNQEEFFKEIYISIK
ncbi:segregation/condensation protein A [Candidatus Aenigmatarchaeota archaeon]